MSSSVSGMRSPKTNAAAASIVPCNASAGPVASKPSVHHGSSSTDTSVSSTAHHGASIPSSARSTGTPSAWENRRMCLTFRTVTHSGDSIVPCERRRKREGPLLPGLDLALRPPLHVEDAPGPLGDLEIQLSASTDLHRKAADALTHEVDVLARLDRPRRGPEPFDHRGREGAAPDPPHLERRPLLHRADERRMCSLLGEGIGRMWRVNGTLRCIHGFDLGSDGASQAAAGRTDNIPMG